MKNKYRAKRLDNNKWVYGELHECCDVPHIHIPYSTIIYNIDIKTIQHFIGIYDVDDKEIYEGDIVNSTYEYRDLKIEITGVIELDKCNPCYCIRYKKHVSYFSEYDFISCGYRKNKIIGNIFDNPELL